MYDFPEFLQDSIDEELESQIHSFAPAEKSCKSIAFGMGIN